MSILHVIAEMAWRRLGGGRLVLPGRVAAISRVLLQVLILRRISRRIIRCYRHLSLSLPGCIVLRIVGMRLLLLLLLRRQRRTLLIRGAKARLAWTGCRISSILILWPHRPSFAAPILIVAHLRRVLGLPGIACVLRSIMLTLRCRWLLILPVLVVVALRASRRRRRRRLLLAILSALIVRHAERMPQVSLRRIVVVWIGRAASTLKLVLRRAPHGEVSTPASRWWEWMGCCARCLELPRLLISALRLCPRSLRKPAALQLLQLSRSRSGCRAAVPPPLE